MFQDIIERVYLGNRVVDYFVFVGLFFASFAIIKIFNHFILKRLKKWSEKTATTIDDFLLGVIQKQILPLSYFGAFYLSVNILNLDPLFKKIIDIIGTAILMIFAARLILALINYGFNVYFRKRGKDVEADRSLTGVLAVLKIVVWALAIVMFLDNLGFKISALIAGLGIGGIAIALAAQAVLGDLFSYFCILFDRPFEVGDFIILGEYLGTIEHVGIKTTRIRSLGGEQIILSNTDLTSSRVRNYKRMGQRRVTFKLGVTYQTTLEQLQAAPKIIEKIIKDVKDTTFDRAHFSSYGDFSLIFEVVYYVMSRDYNKYMDIQQEINFAIKKEFEARNMEFAYPTQTLFVSK